MRDKGNKDNSRSETEESQDGGKEQVSAAKNGGGNYNLGRFDARRVIQCISGARFTVIIYGNDFTSHFDLRF
jgi:hypothetical protein